MDLITSKQQALGVFPQADLVRLLPTQKSRRHRQQPQAVCPSSPPSLNALGVADLWPSIWYPPQVPLSRNRRGDRRAASGEDLKLVEIDDVRKLNDGDAAGDLDRVRAALVEANSASGFNSTGFMSV